jgi:hypothetical protein
MMRFGFPRLPLSLAVACAVIAPRGSASAADPTMEECVAANEKAGPLQHSGKLREARASLLRCSAASCPSVVRDDCIKGATQIDAALPTIVFEAQDAAGNDMSAVRVTMDGEEIANKLTGGALEIDPGEHAFVFEGGGQTVEKRLIIHQGEKNRRERIVLAAASPASPAGSSAQNEGTPEATASGLGSQKTLAIVAGGAGVAGIAVGSVLGLLASSKWNQAKTDCGAGCAPGTPAQDEASNAHSMATLANVSFAVGGVALAAGAVLWVLAPRAKPASALRVGPFVAGSSAGLTAAWSTP